MWPAFRSLVATDERAVSGALGVSVGYAAIGGASVVGGALFSTRHELRPRTKSLVHHAAAGTVLAGLVVDVFARLLALPHHLLYTAVGMVAGLSAMLAIRAMSERAKRRGGEANASLVPTILSDVLSDGVLIGLSAALDAGRGLLFAIALAPEISLLGVAAAQAMRDRWDRRRIVAAAAGIGAGITGAGAIGWSIAQTTTAAVTVVLGVGASVIVYLILEELLREVHETDTGPTEVAVLFGMFLPFFLAGVALHG